MKIKLFKIMTFAAIILLSLDVSSASRNGDVLATKENKLLTAQLLVNEIRKNIKTSASDVEFLYREMNSNMKMHQNPQDSRAICRKITEDHLLKKYNREVVNILDKLDADKPEDIKSWFDQKEREKLLNTDMAIQENINKYFDSTFRTVRSKVCKEQITRLIGDVCPTEEEVETVSRNQLRERLLEQVIKKQKEPVFVENKPLLSKNVIDPILDDADKQRREQLRIVEKSTGGNMITPADIQTFTENELREYREALQKLRGSKKIAGKIYDIFPSVKKKIRPRSEQMAVKKFSRSLLYPSFPVSQQNLHNLIKNNLPRHIHTEESRRLCLDYFRQDIQKKVVEKYARTVSEPKRSGFRIFLKQLIADNDECRKAFVKLIERSLYSNFKKARQDISKEQFGKFFSPLASNSWRPGCDKIDSFYNKLYITIPQPLSMEGISSGSFDSSILLGETRAMVAEAEKKQIGEGLDALRKQMHIVDELEVQVKRELEKSSFLPTVEELIKLFTSEVKSKWSFVTLAEKYEKLFPRTLKDIERRSKAMLPVEKKRRDRIVEIKAKEFHRNEPLLEQGKRLYKDEKKTTLPKNLPLSKGPGTGSGTGGEGRGTHKGKEVKKGNIIPEIIIDLDYSQGSIISDLTLVATKLDSVQFVLSGDPDNDREELLEIQRVFRTWLAPELTKSKEILIHVLTRIYHRRVYYGVVFDLRECLERSVIHHSGKKTIIRWYDCLSRKEEKKKLYIPTELKEKSMPLNK